MLKLFKFGIKTVFRFILNAVVGGIVIYLLNLIPGVMIPITWWSALATGLFGVPAAIVLLILSFFI